MPTEEEQQQLEFYMQPESWFLDNLQGSRETIDNQTIDPKFQYMLEQSRGGSKFMMRIAPVIFATPWGRSYIRNQVDRSWRLFSSTSKLMMKIENRIVEGTGGPIPIRLYYPEIASGAEPLPILIYHHGGGYVFASIAALDRVAQLIANEAGVLVISVDYRLAPENSYPAASDDGEDVFDWAKRNAVSIGGTPELIAVGGDSAGGHIAVNISQRKHQRNEPAPVAMFLMYPAVCIPNNDPSYELFGEGYFLDRAFMDFVLPRIFPGYSLDRPERIDALMNPASSADLSGLPPSIIATAGFDILRDCGRRFAEKLEAAGSYVSYRNHPSLVHSFMQYSAISQDAYAATARSAAELGEILKQRRGNNLAITQYPE